MTEKELLSQLNKLSQVRPNKDWREKNKNLLLKQVYGSRAEGVTAFKKRYWLTMLSKRLSLQTLRSASQPMVMVFVIALFVLGGGVFSIRAAKDTKPGDSLYIAKIINEKTQRVFTFNEKKKAQLGLEFAHKRVVEINKILQEPVAEEKKTEQVAKLINNFKKEIITAKTHIQKIHNEKKYKENENQENSEENNKSGKETTIAMPETGTGTESVEPQVFSANLNKDKQGMQLSEQKKQKKEEEPLVITENKEEEGTATSTTEILAEETKKEVSVVDAQDIITQAEELFDQEDYSATLNKLDEAGTVIDNAVDLGEVKGATEEASSSESNLDSTGKSEEGEVLGETETSEEAVDEQASSSEGL